MRQQEKQGSIHPITSMISELVEICVALGYTPVIGNEIENEYYNFDALNIPKTHPARDMHDTFWIKNEKGKLLRTHISNMQIRYMEKNKPPLKIVAPGKVFRNEATDMTHEAQFHYMEGLCVSENTTLADMKGTLNHILRMVFGDDVQIRYRPSFFSFTEPSLEVDMKRKGDERWIEVLGCGMVHPQLLTRTGIDPQRHQGFAFGMGIDRIAMFRYGFNDVRLLYKGDLELVNQF